MPLTVQSRGSQPWMVLVASFFFFFEFLLAVFFAAFNISPEAHSLM